MATAPHFSLPHKPLEEMMKNLKVVDSSAHLSSSNKVPSKEESPSDATSCISSTGDAICSLKESDVDHESLATDQGATYQAGAYYGYCYPGYDGAFWEVDDQGYYVAGDGMELQYPVIQADNGSFMYVIPAFQPGYSSYGPYLPVATFGVDGQYLGQQPFLPGPLFQPSIASPGYHPNALPHAELVPSPYPCDPSFLVGDATYGNNFNWLHEIPCSKSNVSSASHNHAPVLKKLPNSDFGHLPELKKPLPSLNVSTGHDMHQLKPTSKALQHGSTLQPDAPGRGYFPFAKFPLYNQGKVGVLYSNSAVDYKPNVRGWGGSEKAKTRSRVSSISDFGLLTEQKYVPRTTNTKDALVSGVNTVGPLATDENGNSDSTMSLIRKDQYNLPDFPTKYDQALFFVIKSYSEDDIHKSIKYNVWASTPNGNKRLDSAYKDAQNRKAEKGSKCPVFLFFSVNASGQFCGVAEMIGHVDFNKSMDFWQQDKWSGYFPVQWHIVKDVPNPQLRHIILENNDNKPVTNSRDTQEVRFSHGIEMLNILKNYPAKTCILDDFDFYESRQKVMQEKKIRPSMPHHDHIQQKADELTANFQPEELSAAENSEEPRKE